MQRLHDLLARAEYTQFRRVLAHAELSNLLSQVYVLSFHALLAIIEGSDLARDYLEMAEAVARSPRERATLAESWATYELRRDNPAAAAQRCLSTLANVWQTEELWITLLVALDRMGDTAMIDATLRCFAVAEDATWARLVHSVSARAGLREVRKRSAYRDFVLRKAA
jgi:hypothetical protein